MEYPARDLYVSTVQALLLCYVNCSSNGAFLHQSNQKIYRWWYSLYSSQVAHQAGAYLVFCSTWRLGVFQLPPPFPLDGVLQRFIQGFHPAYAMSAVRPRSRTASSGVEHTNQEPTAPSKILSIIFEAIQVEYAHVLYPVPINYDTTKWVL